MNDEKAVPPSLKFGGNEQEPDVRHLTDMADVIYDKEWLSTAGNPELYYMYRDLSLSRNDYRLMKERALRYDITAIPPGTLGKEYVKTAGHYHPRVPGTEISYTEIYEVLEGSAHYFLQKADPEEDERITDVVLIRCGPGDKAVIPPDYGHVTINPTNKTIKMCNWVSRNFSSIYEPYRKLKGAAYYEMEDGNFIPNHNYKEVPEIREIKTTNYGELGLIKGREMYGLIREKPEYLEYLNRPQDYDWLWKKILE